jgi:hypothetical protein
MTASSATARGFALCVPFVLVVVFFAKFAFRGFCGLKPEV